MKITVAVPCYNGAAFVSRTIESVLAQTRPAHQIFVVDDGSTDPSRDIIQRYPVTLLPHPVNRGLAAARNTALSAAAGDVLVFVDVDAFAAPDLLERLSEGYKNPEPNLAGVGGQGIEANIASVADSWRRAHASQSHGSLAGYVTLLYGLCMSFRVEILQQVGGFNPDFRTNAEDTDVCLRLIRAGYRLRYWPTARVFHQRQDDVASLRRAIRAWYYAAYRAKLLNHAQPWTLFAGTLRRFIVDPLQDLFVWRDPALMPLSLELCWVKLRALWQAARESQRRA